MTKILESKNKAESARALDFEKWDLESKNQVELTKILDSKKRESVIDSTILQDFKITALSKISHPYKTPKTSRKTKNTKRQDTPATMKESRHKNHALWRDVKKRAL